MDKYAPKDVFTCATTGKSLGYKLAKVNEDSKCLSESNAHLQGFSNPNTAMTPSHRVKSLGKTLTF